MDQVLKIEQINLNFEKRIEEIRKQNSNGRRQMGLTMREIMQEKDEKIEIILTDSQKEVYQKIKKERGRGSGFRQEIKERGNENN